MPRYPEPRRWDAPAVLAPGGCAWFTVGAGTAFGGPIVSIDRVVIDVRSAAGGVAGHVHVTLGMGTNGPPRKAIPITVTAFAPGIPPKPQSVAPPSAQLLLLGTAERRLPPSRPPPRRYVNSEPGGEPLLDCFVSGNWGTRRPSARGIGKSAGRSPHRTGTHTQCRLRSVVRGAGYFDGSDRA
jgi:hypothetical protein